MHHDCFININLTEFISLYVRDISDKAAKLAKKHLARITSAEDLGKKAKAAKAFYLWAIDALKQRDQLKSKDMTTTA